ncbi:Cortactin-binding protein 2 [Labeo rohita]|uniref:Cortactin-binding protein 2 n=1 Tax=Labeo rohita TaxID=84645 RepID=A0ABQ8KZA9_LABRO|nr:Cortactin-binding protein 2 [Labeo rohita]
MSQEAEKAFRRMQINKEREEEVRREMEAIKAKYESEIKEIQVKLEEEKAKGKEREFLFLERENTLLRNYQAGKINRVTTDSEQTKSCVIEQCKAMEEYMQKMEEIKKRYKEIEEIHAAEFKKIQERHSGNITTWNKTHGNCVLQ